MHDYYPLLIAGAIIGVFSAALILAYVLIKDKKESMGFDRTVKDSEIIKRLLAYAKPYAKNFLLVLVLVLIAIAYDIAAPILIGEIEEIIKNSFELSTLFIRVGIYASMLICSLAAGYFQSLILQKTGQKIVSALRADLFEHIEQLSAEQLNHIPVGKLVTRVTNDINGISIMFTNLVASLVQNCFVIIGVLIAMLALNYELTLMVLCFVPFIVLFTVLFRKFSRKAYRRVRDCTTDINTFLSENLSGIKITQIFNRENKKLEEFTQKNNQLGSALSQQIFVFGIFRPMVYMLYTTSVMCLFYLGASGYINNTVFLGQTITSGTVVSFYMFISKFFNPIQSLAEQFNRLQWAFASAEKIFLLLDTPPAITDSPDAIELEKVHGNIEFKHVWFAYTEDNWILKDVSFTVNAGETVAFVGATGAGKTTILSLICRNYDIQRGEILIDGINIKNIKISSLRKHFGQMLQDVFLFSGTIRSNIVLREESFSDEEVMDACRYVNADKFINKCSNGLDEQILERGNNLSAGQRQLLSFARTIIHKPDVLILDEATSNIDTETEMLIQDSLEKMMNSKTMLIVAHRLSTIKNADKIIVLSHGEIQEEGSHSQLLELKGKYYELYTLARQHELLKEAAAHTV